MVVAVALVVCACGQSEKGPSASADTEPIEVTVADACGAENEGMGAVATSPLAAARESFPGASVEPLDGWTDGAAVFEVDDPAGTVLVRQQADGSWRRTEFFPC